MLLQSIPAEQRTVLYNVSWETFEALLRDTGEDRSSRFAYECGTLEIKSSAFLHENIKIQFNRFILVLAEEFNTEIISAGSTTLKLKSVNSAIEPDNCFYIQKWQLIKGKQTLNLETDPPPDLAIEIDITSSSVNKFNIYAALGVDELWKYDGEVLKFYQLVENQYVEIKFSMAFSLVSVGDMNRFIQQSKTMGEIDLVRSFRTWVREKIG